jgi:hypothetical protein
MRDEKLRSLMAERRVQANEGKEVPRLTERFLMDVHEVLGLRLDDALGPQS